MTDTDVIKVALEDVRNATAELRQDLQNAQAGWQLNVDSQGKLARTVGEMKADLQWMRWLVVIPCGLVALAGSGMVLLVGLRLITAALELFRRGEALALW